MFAEDLQQVEDLEKYGDVDQRQLWKTVNRRIKGRGSRIQPLQVENGEILTEVDEIREGWKNYFQKLYSPLDLPSFDQAHKEQVEATLHDILHDDTPSQGTLYAAPITQDEVSHACKKLRTGKAAGFDGVKPESLKYAGPVMCKLLSNLFTGMVQQE